MKKILYIIVPLAISMAGCDALMQTTTVYDSNADMSYSDPSSAYGNQAGYDNSYPVYDGSPQTDQVFYDELSPYGTWVNYQDYGYVWVPDVGLDFRPYATNGYWGYSDYGWTWISNYAWGWAPFHYGSWLYDDAYGWMWVPGDEWAPAWVTWGSYGDYYCWAPITPGAGADREGRAPADYSWNVVPRKRIAQRDMNNYIVKTNDAVVRNVTRNVVFINNTTVSGNRGGDRNSGSNSNTHRQSREYNRGPRVYDVETAANTHIKMVTVDANTRPGAQLISGDKLLVYRPDIKPAATGPGSTTPAPRRIGQSRSANGGGQPTVTPQNTRPDNNQNQRPANQPQPDNNKTRRPINQPQVQPGVTPGSTVRPGNQPRVQPSVTPDKEPVNTPQPTPRQQPVYQPQQQPERRPEPTPRQQPVNQPQQQPVNRPQPTPTQQPTYQLQQQPERRPEPTPTPRQQPVYQPQQQPERRPEPTPTPRQQPVYQPQQQPERRPEPAPTPTQIQRPVVQPQPERRPEPAPVQIQRPAVQPQPERRPEPAPVQNQRPAVQPNNNNDSAKPQLPPKQS